MDVIADNNRMPLVSVIVPCRNEGNYIRECLESIVRNDYPNDQIEIIVVDGVSEDGTRATVEEYAARYPFVHLLDNAKRITPTALNLGILHAKGEVVVRMDAHVEYPADYISSLVRCLMSSGADNVGSVCVTLPGNDTPMAKAIAVGLSHPFGIGNSQFRIGAATARWVDTVPFGCYRRDVFDRIGLFDEELARNQDDEFNLRLIRSGGRILLTPEVTCRYYARDSLRKLWRMYFQYGYFKPLVVRKVRGVMTLRQLAPPALVIGLLGAGALAPWSRVAMVVFAMLVLVYGTAILACAARAVVKHGLPTALRLLLVFPAMHISYGLGYLRGMVEFLLLRRDLTKDSTSVPMSR